MMRVTLMMMAMLGRVMKTKTMMTTPMMLLSRGLIKHAALVSIHAPTGRSYPALPPSSLRRRGRPHARRGGLEG